VSTTLKKTSPLRKRREYFFRLACKAVTVVTMLVLFVLLLHVFKEGVRWLSIDFLNRFPSRFPEKAGLKSALWGTLWLVSMSTMIAVPFGISTALYLEEYTPRNFLIRLVQINIANLASMPSIVYGLLGLSVFVRFFGFDRSVLAGSLTLALLVLPLMIIASQEAIRAVPDSIRHASYALGARKWQVTFTQVLPAALPGIMTGIILSICRTLGESAPMIMIGALSYVAFVPSGPLDAFTTLPIQIFSWAGRPQANFQGIAAAGILVLLAVLFLMTLGAVLIRQRFQRYRI